VLAPPSGIDVALSITIYHAALEWWRKSVFEPSSSSAPAGAVFISEVTISTGCASLHPWLQSFAPLGQGGTLETVAHMGICTAWSSGTLRGDPVRI